MSLLEEIVEAAVDSRTSVADVLRKCAVLASRLGNQELQDWVHHELNGYPTDAELPDYRILNAQAKGHFQGPFGSGYKNLVIPASALPEEYRDWGRRVFVRQPIASCVALAQTDPGGHLSTSWPGDLLAAVADNIYQGMQCYGAWQTISHGAFVGLVDSVRNRVLDFALRLEKEAPTAGERSSGPPPISDERVTSLYQMIIVGNVGNVAAGTTGSIQIAQTVQKGDLTALKQELLRLGLQQEEVRDLEEALQEDRDAPGIGPRTSAWISRLLGKVPSGAVKIGSGTAIGVIVKLISEYLGIG